MISQKTMPWGNHLLGTSNYYIWAKGCLLTALADFLTTTPDDVNEKLKAVNGFAKDNTGQISLIIWAKIKEAFPEFSAFKHSVYNNDDVLVQLAAGNGVVVEVDAGPIGNPGGSHWVRYIGDHKLHDPWTGTERPTSDFPTVKSYAVITKQAAKVEEKPAPAAAPAVAPVAAVPTPEIYQGLDLGDIASVKVAIDAWKEVADGAFIRKTEHEAQIKAITEALGISAASDLTAITESIKALKEEFAKQVIAQTQPAPAQIEGQGVPVAAVPPSIKNAPQSDKDAVIHKVHTLAEELKALLGV